MTDQAVINELERCVKYIDSQRQDADYKYERLVGELPNDDDAIDKVDATIEAYTNIRAFINQRIKEIEA